MLYERGHSNSLIGAFGDTEEYEHKFIENNHVFSVNLFHIMYIPRGISLQTFEEQKSPN